MGTEIVHAVQPITQIGASENRSRCIGDALRPRFLPLRRADQILAHLDDRVREPAPGAVLPHAVAREFAVDLPTTKALIDRGVPFTFTTVEPTNSHLQAVVGYDARTRTLLVRDSNYRGLGELMSEKGLEHYLPTGPRGMVLVPQEEAARLDGLALPDAMGLGESRPMLLVEQGAALGALRRFDAALASYEEALAIPGVDDQTRAYMMRGRGGVLIDLNRLDEAEASFRDSLKLAPDSAVAKNELQYIANLRADKPVNGSVMTKVQPQN